MSDRDARTDEGAAWNSPATRAELDGNSAEVRRVQYALDLVGVSKSFRRNTIGGAGYTTLKSLLFDWGSHRKRERAVRRTEAIRDLTLRIPQGSSVGIIGRNGSGKSTLLKLITGIYRPDCGEISVKGRVAALIELGAGFHPDFTGRENLHLGGVMHGLSRKEIDARFSEIVDFAELSEVIDDPVRTYSSGMYMRLGFSLAVHTDPDVLLIDEVLAVGDAKFVTKCKEKLEALQGEGKTLLMVSHDLLAVERWCDEVLWLDRGSVRDRGEPRRVIDHYLEYLERGEEEELFAERAVKDEGAASSEGEEQAADRWGSREIEIRGVRLTDPRGADHLIFHPEEGMVIEMAYAMNEPIADVVFGIAIHRADGVAIHGTNTDLERVELPPLCERGVVRYSIRRLGLCAGSYALDVAVHRQDGYPFDYHRRVLKFSVRATHDHVGVYIPDHRWEIVPGESVS